MKNKLTEIVQQIRNIQGCQFVSFTYLTKGTKELSRYTFNVGFNYNTLVKKSIVELQILIREQKSTWNSLQRVAAARVMKSLRLTLHSHNKGEQNPNYTKIGQYIPIVNGININTTDNTVQLFGLLRSKVVLMEGEYKKVNHRPLTVEQDKIRKQLSVSQFREFAVDLTNVGSVRVNGETVELVPLQ